MCLSATKSSSFDLIAQHVACSDIANDIIHPLGKVAQKITEC